MSTDSTVRPSERRGSVRVGRGPGHGGLTMGKKRVLGSGIYLVSLLLVAVGCANHSLMPAAQSGEIKNRERALAAHSGAIQAAVKQSGKVGGLAFLDATGGHLVVLPGDSPADAWARYAGLPERETAHITVPEVVTFVYRADVPKAPETVTLSALQYQLTQRTSVAALAAELQRVEEKLSLVQRELAAATAATKQDTDKAMADMRVLADDLAVVRKFVLQTAQLGWLNHEMVLENASGVRKMAAASQDLTASSARVEDSLRQISESVAGQLKELAARLDTIQGKIQNLK
jgi:hypothetical protein